MLIKKKKPSQTEEPLQQDKRLIAKIQPQGGITFNDEKLIKTGDGYEMILHIYRYPKYIDKFWLTQIVNIDNVVVTIDIETKDQQKVKQNINNSMSEQRTRIMYAKDMRRASAPVLVLGIFFIPTDNIFPKPNWDRQLAGAH